MRVFRASSLAAVTNFVWSTSDNRARCARVRTAWRTFTTSASVLTGNVMVSADCALSTARSLTVTLGRGQEDFLGRAFLWCEHPQAALDVESRPHAAQGEAELDHRDRDRGAHADDDRGGVQHA